MNNFYLISFAQALFFVTLILSKKNKLLSDYFLSFFILLLGGQLFFVYSYSSGLFKANPWIVIIDIYYWTLLGPTLLVYTQLITKSRERLEWNYLFYLLPTVMVTIGFAKYIFMDGSNFFIDTTTGNWFFDLSTFVWLYNSPLFYIITIIILRKHPKRIKQYYSYSKDIDLKWLNFLSSGFAVFLFFLLFNSYLKKLIHIEFPPASNYLWLIMVLYIFGIGFYGYKQKGIFSQFETFETGHSKSRINILKLEASEKASYQKSGLNKDEATQLSQNLITIMEKEKFYLDSNLNLLSLSRKLGTTTHKLSQVINENFNKNFFEFINDYRIKEVQAQLSDPEKNKYKIISIANDCGFNNKSTFYTLFKKSTSLTPAEFREKFQKQAV